MARADHEQMNEHAVMRGKKKKYPTSKGKA